MMSPAKLARSVAAIISVCAFFVSFISAVTAGHAKDFGDTQQALQAARLALDSGKLVKAEKLLRSCIKKANAQGNTLGEAKARKWLGVTLGRMGYDRFDEALEELEASKKLLGKLTASGNKRAREQEAFVSFDLAQLYLRSAEANLKESLLKGVSGSYFDVLKQYVNPARNCIEDARRSYPPSKKADLVLAEADIALLVARYGRVFMPQTATGQRFEKAAQKYSRALNVEEDQGANSRGDVIAQAYMGLGVCRRQQSTLKDGADARRQLLNKAQTAFEKALNSETDHVEQQISAAVLKAATVMDLREAGQNTPHDGREIEKLLRRAALRVERMRQDVTSAQTYGLAVSFFSRRTAVYEQMVRLYAMRGEPANMLRAIERMKARAFREKLRQGEAQGDRNQTEQFNVAETVRKLKEEQAILAEFFYGPRYAWVLIITPDGSITPRRLSLSGQELVRKLRNVISGYSNQLLLRMYLRQLRYRGEVPDNFLAAFKDSAELYQEILKPVIEVAAEHEARAVYLVPHHLLHYTPFCALVTKLNEKAPIASGYYVEDYDIPLCYLPSAGVLSFIKPAPQRTASLIMARSDFRDVLPTYPTDLRNSVSEAESISSLIEGKLLTESDATEDAFRRMASDRSLLYLATHGVLKSDDSMNSAILLAASQGRGHDTDGELTVRELISDLKGDINADLVVLSACQTNKARLSPVSGDDLAALSRGFMMAGARSVIATQWDASDDVFPMIMRRFVEEWKKEPGENTSKASALHSAIQQFLREKDMGVYRHPLFWAPIVLLGHAR